MSVPQNREFLNNVSAHEIEKEAEDIRKAMEKEEVAKLKIIMKQAREETMYFPPSFSKLIVEFKSHLHNCTSHRTHVPCTRR